MRIEFRDLTNMKKIVHQHSVLPDEPNRLCTAGPSTLLYSDRSTPCVIRQLDCSTATPKPDAGELVTQQNSIYDICCTEGEGKSVVVTADCSTIRCYNRESGELL